MLLPMLLRRRIRTRRTLLLLIVLTLRVDALTLLLVPKLSRALAVLLIALLRDAGLIITQRCGRRCEGRLARLRRGREGARAARWRVAAEDDARIYRTLANRRGAIGGRRLMRGRHTDPDAAHARRRPMAIRHARW